MVSLSLASCFFPSPRYLLMIAFPPVASIVAIAIIIFTTGYTILVADNALLPTKRDTNIPSMIVYIDINIIMMMEGAANRNNLKGVNS